MHRKSLNLRHYWAKNCSNNSWNRLSTKLGEILLKIKIVLLMCTADLTCQLQVVPRNTIVQRRLGYRL